MKRVTFRIASMVCLALLLTVTSQAQTTRLSVEALAKALNGDDGLTIPDNFVGLSTRAVILKARTGDALAVKWVLDSAAQNNPYAQYALGWMYEHGVQVPQDAARAQELYEKAAQQNNPDAAFKLSQIKPAEGKTALAGKMPREWLAIAARAGSLSAQGQMQELLLQKDPYALFETGIMYFNGEGKPKDWKKGLELVIQAADLGNANALYELGIMRDYGYLGDLYPQNKKTAVAFYKQAARKGLADAQYNLAVCYDMGNGTAVNRAKAAQWYQKAVDQNYAKAQSNLGMLYQNGTGVKQDYGKAMTLYRLADAQGMADAANNIGTLYNMGQGVTKDPVEAVKWFRKAAGQGLATAQLNMGEMYDMGKAVPQDLAEAARWYKLAADQGNLKAEYNLATMYENGEGGLPKDKEKAWELYRKSAEGGYDPAIKATKHKNQLPLKP